MKRLILLLLLTAASWAQGTFVAYHTASDTSDKVTIQQPSTGAKSVQMLEAFASSTVACSATLSQAGTAATTTALTPAGLGQGGAALTPTAFAFSASNVGSGTTLAVYDLPANGSVSLDLRDMAMIGNGTAKNVSLGLSCESSGTLRIAVKWREQ